MLIFHTFPTKLDAEAFAKAVTAKFNTEATAYASREEADKVDEEAYKQGELPPFCFPYELTPPIVLVERPDTFEQQERVINLVEQFAGSFAGT